MDFEIVFFPGIWFARQAMQRHMSLGSKD